jgi:hypothetical protein
MVAERVAAETDHEIQWIEGYSGSIVKNTEVLEGVQNGIVDIGGMCYCFEPSNLPLHAFQVMLPFGTMNPITSLRIAQRVYAQEPYLTDVFEDKFDQVLLARITDQGYNLGTTFTWTDLSELDGEKNCWRWSKSKLVRICWYNTCSRYSYRGLHWSCNKPI